MMHRSILALTALVAFAIGSSVAYADCGPGHIASSTKQTVASADNGGVTPVPVQTSGDGS
ncbi:MAG TPA: hypothetical protein VFV80_04590 [Geminicoccaceae bacterium]|nr:hypothetical protein [Geminicoccaceae bacterium]